MAAPRRTGSSVCFRLTRGRPRTPATRNGVGWAMCCPALSHREITPAPAASHPPPTASLGASLSDGHLFDRLAVVHKYRWAGLAVFLIAMLQLVELPFGFYQGYLLEHRYGLSNETPGQWLRDQLKGLALALDLPIVPVHHMEAHIVANLLEHPDLELPASPRATVALYRASQAALHPPLVHCVPAGGPGFFNAPGFEIVDAPDLQKVFILNIAGAHSWRVIYLDGREHPAAGSLRPTFFGHSIGRWDGDTLVVDTVGFNEQQWLAGTYPTTSQLHLTERFSRPNLRTLVYEATIDDPGAYTAPWTIRWRIDEKSKSSWIDGGEIFEYICQDDRG